MEVDIMYSFLTMNEHEALRFKHNSSAHDEAWIQAKQLSGEISQMVVGTSRDGGEKMAAELRASVYLQASRVNIKTNNAAT